MRRMSRTLISVALAAVAVAGTAGWASGDAQEAVTGAPVGTGAWVGAGLPDPGRVGPVGIARFFAGLDPVKKRKLVREHPGVVGNLDGVPPELRYEANALVTEGAFGGARVLAYDPRGRGQVALVYGDLARAAHMAVVVPGSDVDAGHVRPLADMAPRCTGPPAAGRRSSPGPGTPPPSASVWTRPPAGSPRPGPSGSPGSRTAWRPSGPPSPRCSATATARWSAGSPPTS